MPSPFQQASVLGVLLVVIVLTATGRLTSDEMQVSCWTIVACERLLGKANPN